MIAMAIYGGFGLLTWHYAALPWWIVLPFGGFLVAWHGSLQHEVVHGHPTTSPLVNELFVLPSLWLWLPFRVYRTSHLMHHRIANLTDPLEDPESYYLAPREWAKRGPFIRAILQMQNTSLGRLLLGPLNCALKVIWQEGGLLLRGDGRHLKAWALHIFGCALTLGWAMGVCGIPLVEYILLFAYPGLSLTLLRSFLEHQAEQDPEKRTAIVEGGPLMSLLYLNNNFHVVHHDFPGVAWYRLPAIYRADKNKILRRNGGYRFNNYATVVLRYLLHPKEPVAHPLLAQPSPTPPPGPLQQAAVGS